LNVARILYFAGLVDRLGRAAEEAELPASVTNVQSLLAWLRLRGEPWERALADGAVRVTVDRQFSVAETPISNANEIALINTRPL
jgi:molybdopterin synthase sulfur carrier subunit